MVIDCISDLHGYFPKLDGGDLLIIAGDCTGSDGVSQWCDFFYWLKAQEYDKKIIVAGNHDNFCTQWAIDNDDIYDIIGERSEFLYLQDSGCEYKELNIWGSPWTPLFDEVNPKCKAFMLPEKELADKWKKIPFETDLLITHGPPNGILDSIYLFDGTMKSVGSVSLRNEVIGRIKPMVHVFGHIHEWGGNDVDCVLTRFVNCSHVNQFYKPKNKHIRVEL